MNKIIIDENYIKSLPLTTNRIEVAWNENVFFSKYAIVSYYSTSAYSGGYPFSISGDIRSLPS